jgi:tetratricopeptide (TPR) repeat protein
LILAEALEDGKMAKLLIVSRLKCNTVIKGKLMVKSVFFLFLLVFTLPPVFSDGYSTMTFDQLCREISLNPDKVEPYEVRGIHYLLRGEIAEAIQDLDMAISLQPQRAESYYVRGGIYGNVGNHEEALRDFNRAISLSPSEEKYYYARGTACVSLKNYQQAVEDLGRSIAENPNRADAYFQRGEALLEQKQVSAAYRDYCDAIERDPRFIKAYFRRAAIQIFMVPNPDYAMVDINNILAIDPDNITIYFLRSHVYMLKGMWEEAFNDISIYISFDPNYPPAYFARAILYRRQGKYIEALTDCNSGINLWPNQSSYYDTRSAILFSLAEIETDREKKSEYQRMAEMDADMVKRLRGDIDAQR